MNRSLLRAGLWVGIGVLVAAEVVAELRILRHRFARTVAEYERREHAAARRAEMAVLVREVGRSVSGANGSTRESGGPARR